MLTEVWINANLHIPSFMWDSSIAFFGCGKFVPAVPVHHSSIYVLEIT